MITISIMEKHRKFLALLVSAGTFADEEAAALAILTRGIEESEWDLGLQGPQDEISDLGEALAVDEETVLQGPAGQLSIASDEKLESRLKTLLEIYKNYPQWKAEAGIWAFGLCDFYHNLKQHFVSILDEMPHYPDEDLHSDSESDD